MTAFIEFHGWQGISVGAEAQSGLLILGFITIGGLPYRLTARLRRLVDELRKLKGDA